MKKFHWEKKYIHLGITSFLVIAAAIVFYMMLSYVGVLANAISKLVKILSPFIWGLVIAYLLTPSMNFFENKLAIPLLKKLGVKNKADVNRPKGARAISVTLSIIALILIIAAFFYLIIPQLYTSIETIISNSSLYGNKIAMWADKFLSDYPQIEEYAVSLFGNLTEALKNWFKTAVLPSMENLIQNLTHGVMYFLTGVYNVVIGIIVSVYILHNKEAFSVHSKKIMYSIFSVETSGKIQNAISFTDKTFMGFITGKLIDSLIIGIICYIFNIITSMPYALLVGVIIGITNIIPFFGPVIGAVPCALLILLVNPTKCLVFVIFAIVLQQFDGNILGPKILGSKTGINGFWVMFAIILGAGLFGFIGMLIGVPLWVVIYTGVGNLVDRRLAKNGLPNDAYAYANIDFIDPETNEIKYKSDKTSETVNKKEEKEEHPKKEAPHDKKN